ncbi:hypothetical protein [Nocardia salmonicida]|uniref:hypothetical protein n=1 Tax=Nocardia salmonicida TaxID=53431 RepID=UPI0033D61905
MTSFMLSPNRRDELAALLGDEERLQVEYPKVAEYLDTAATLPTADQEQARLLDLRMLHFMTGGTSSNPYWEIVEPLVGGGAGERVIAGSARLAYAQTVLQEQYAYGIPSPSTVDWIAAAVDGRGLCEIGAGRGYWAAMLSAHGVDVRAFDSEPPGSTVNPSFPDAEGRRAIWHRVDGLSDLAVAWSAERLGDRVLFLCWPPGWENPMSAQSLREYTAFGGEQLIYIGEPRGGKTGSTEFFEELSKSWTLEASDDSFVSWWNLDDAAQLWHRK